MNLRVLSLSIATVGLAGAAAAQPPVPPPAAKPAAELAQLKLFVGSWKCAGKQLASALTGPAHDITGSAQARPEAEGFWQVFTYEEKKTKDHPGIKVMGLWGYDAAGRRFVRAAGNNQGVWDTATSAGWEHDKLVWIGEFAGPLGRTPFRHTFEKKSDKEWSHKLELNRESRWIPVSEVSCTKTK